MKIALSLFFYIVSSFAVPSAEAFSPSDTVNELNFDRIKSLNEMKAAINLLQSACLEAKKEGIFSFNFQKLALSKAGESISRIVSLEQKSIYPSKKASEEVLSLLLQDREVIKDIINWNKRKVEDFQENKLDSMKDTSAFFSSPEWQQPQYIISLASYWLSWNEYYSSLFYPANNTVRSDLLVEAAEGFSRSFIDFKEDSIVSRSLFGRALCYKEMQKYDKAILDLDTVTGMVDPSNELNARCRYEKVTITFLSGNYEAALNQLDKFSNGGPAPEEIGSGLKNLRIKIMLALLDKEKDKKGITGKKLFKEAIGNLKDMSETDDSLSGEFYRFASDHVPMLEDMPYGELGLIGNLAIGDFYFKREEYGKAAARYEYLRSYYGSRLKKPVDEVYFKLGYCFCRRSNWQDALNCFKFLFEKYPASDFIGKSACLNYVAATNIYKGNPKRETYAAYIESTRYYLRHCPDPRDKSEAHFQLGKYYLDKGQAKEAFNEFTLVGDDSPNSLESQYYVLKAKIEKIEAGSSAEFSQGKDAKNNFQNTLSQLEKYQKKIIKQKESLNKKELEAQLAILKAKLYAFGPEETCKKTVEVLNGFERNYKLENREQHFLTVTNLRMQCFQRLRMFNEAKAEISRFLSDDVINYNRWNFLNESANRFYKEAKRLRQDGNINQADKQNEIALLIYREISPIALKNSNYKKYFDPIQLRMAEIYMDENQTGEAKKIYMAKLERNPDSADAVYNLGLIQEREGKWEDALDNWRKFTKGLKTGSYYWYESRYRTANALNHLGKDDEACEVINVMKVLHPQLRDDQFREKFTKLEKDICERKGD